MANSIHRVDHILARIKETNAKCVLCKNEYDLDATKIVVGSTKNLFQTVDTCFHVCPNCAKGLITVLQQSLMDLLLLPKEEHKR